MIPSGQWISICSITYLAPSVEQLTGYTPEELKQVPLNKQLTPASLAFVEEAISEEFSAEDRQQPRNPNLSRNMELEIIRKDGSRLWEEVTVTFNRDENGKPFEILGIARDISDRKRTEAIIHESEKRYRMIAENMNDIIWTLGMDLQFIYVSPSSTRVTGYTPEETRQTPLNQLLTPESFVHATKRLADELALEASGEPFDRNRHITIEIEALHKDGGTIWLEITGTFNRDHDGNITEILVVGKDITARKKVEIALEESEKRYRMIVENMQDTIWTMNFDLQYTYQSPSEIRVTGFTAEEMMQIPVQDQLTPESYAMAEKILVEELELEFSGRPVDLHRYRTMELEIYKKGGGTIWEEVTASFNRDDQGKPVEIMMTGRDITERKKAEDALKENEKRFRMIVENMHDVIWTTDLNLQYTYISPASKNIMGYTPEEMNSMPIGTQLTPESFALVKKIFAEEFAMESGENDADPNRSRIFEVEVIHKNGSTVWVEITATFNRDENGKPVEILLAGRNITERKKMLEEKDKLEKQLIQAQKMETVGRLAGGVAHDFNNMLSVILGYADLAKLRLPEDNPVLEHISEIEKAAIRSKDITAQLLAFSRKQIIAPKNINLNKMITHTQKALIRLIGEDIDLKFHPEDGIWIIKFDPSQIEQILMNLAVNARDAMPAGGKLTIETANIRLNDAYCREHLGFTPGYYVRLAISDNGTGIDKETLPYIFEPFFTTKETGKGTGLGLATVYGIVKQNGGFINVYSEPGQGTTFKIYLPRSVEEMDIKQDADEEPLVMGSGNILLVEDDALVLSMVTHMLKSAGYTVIASPNPLEALNLCGNGNSTIDLVITDVVMPIMSGRELRDRLSIIRPDIKVLFMSGYTANVIVHHGVLEEGVHFLQKPFSLKELARKLSEIVVIRKD